MKIQSINDGSYLLNLFADFILSYIPKDENSIIQIADCQNFIVIKGRTSSTEILNLSDIKENFIERFGENVPKSFASHTIDLIEYDSKISSDEKYNFKLFSSSNSSYTYREIENYKQGIHEKINKDLIYISEFPHGFSLSMGRTIYYYAKHLVYSIPSNYPFESLEIILPSNFDENNFEVLNEETNDEKLKSFFLDYFDFDYNKFQNKIDINNLYDELLNPTEELNFIKEKPENTFLI